MEVRVSVWEKEMGRHKRRGIACRKEGRKELNRADFPLHEVVHKNNKGNGTGPPVTHTLAYKYVGRGTEENNRGVEK
jgi:hypothetical protein